MTLAFLIIAVLGLSWSNGANDNFKGVATLFGTGTTHYRGALLWATGATLLGSLAAWLVSQRLIVTFSGKGLAPDQLVSQPSFMMAIASAAAATVFLATRLGLPVSTTHALTGALVGAGLAAGGGLDGGVLGRRIVLPLIASPLVAVVITSILYPILRRTRARLGVDSQTCICVGSNAEVVPAGVPGAAIAAARGLPQITTGQAGQCVQHYTGTIVGIGAQSVLDGLHYLSAGAVSFARGLNDTPKIVALLAAAGLLGVHWGILLVAVTMAVGSIVHARRVADTMSRRITAMNHGQGFTANLVTAILVGGASVWGWPVSTTHVSCGALFGIGLVTHQARWRTVATILLAWVTTLPLAAAMAATIVLGTS